MFGKIENQVLKIAPKNIVIGDKRIINPTDETLLSQGYMPIVKTKVPEHDDKHYATMSWERRETEIVQVWEIVEIPETDEITDTEALNILMGGAV